MVQIHIIFIHLQYHKVIFNLLYMVILNQILLQNLKIQLFKDYIFIINSLIYLLLHDIIINLYDVNNALNLNHLM